MKPLNFFFLTLLFKICLEEFIFSSNIKKSNFKNRHKKSKKQFNPIMYPAYGELSNKNNIKFN